MCGRCLRELKAMDVESSRVLFADFSTQMNEAIMMGAFDWSANQKTFNPFPIQNYSLWCRWIKSAGNLQDADDVPHKDRLNGAIKICQLLNSDLEVLLLHREAFSRYDQMEHLNQKLCREN